MSQYDFGTINTATTTGADLATLLQNWRDAVLSNHSGTTRPSYIKAGQIWVNTTTASGWVVNLYNGTDDIPLGYVNSTDATAGFLSRAFVTTKSATATIALTERDMLVAASAPSAAITLTLPTASTAKNGFKIIFQKADNTANTISIARAGSDLVNGGLTYTLAQQYDTVEMISDGTSKWYAYGGVLDGGINTAKIANNAITTAKIADGSVTAAKLDSSIAAGFMPTGTVVPYAGGTAPAGWILSYGQAVSRTTYANLFAVIGTSFGGGDGVSTFNVPDLRGRVVAAADNMGGVSAGRIGAVLGASFGNAGGVETVALSVGQMPSHSHSVYADTGVGTTFGPSIANYYPTRFADRGGAYSYTMEGTATVAPTLGLVGYNGSGAAHSNVQPTIVLNYIIKA